MGCEKALLHQPVWGIHTSVDSAKNIKIYGTIDPKIHPKSFKTSPWGGFIDLWAVSKNLCFCYVVLGRPEIDKNRALGRQGAAKFAPVARWSCDFWDWGPRDASPAELFNNTDGQAIFCIIVYMLRATQPN